MVQVSQSGMSDSLEFDEDGRALKSDLVDILINFQEKIPRVMAGSKSALCTNRICVRSGVTAFVHFSGLHIGINRFHMQMQIYLS